MALDCALRSMCPGYDPLDVAREAGQSIPADAAEKYQVKKKEYWSSRFVDDIQKTLSDGTVFKVVICLRCGDFKFADRDVPHYSVSQHSPCTLSNGDRSESQFYIYYPAGLEELPFTIARVLLYHALRNPSKRSALRKGLLKWLHRRT
ncbi:hypothetical protein CPB86DRAFT_778260 [Serendipita vermifera]|nr:hypothetical protein CPB86DRAFT_778260 [Serendipita vermifera]